MVGGLTCYERRVTRSKLEKADKRWKPLHEGAGASWGSRWKKKLTGKSTWFREGNREENETGGSDGDKENGETAMYLTKEDNWRKQRRENKEKRKREKEERKSEKQRRKNIEITSVMFLEHTKHGELTRRMQGCEDRAGEVHGRRVKMVEQGGSQLKQLLSNTDPWSGEKCPRADCPTCNQSGDSCSEKKDNCFRRNILYEASCGLCEDKRKEEEGEKPKRRKRRKFGELLDGQNIYVGESSRSL